MHDEVLGKPEPLPHLAATDERLILDQVSEGRHDFIDTGWIGQPSEALDAKQSGLSFSRGGDSRHRKMAGPGES